MLDIRIQTMRDYVSANNMIIKSENGFIELFDRIVLKIRMFESESSELHIIMKKFMFFLRQPEEIFAFFTNCISLVEVTGSDPSPDHSSYNSLFRSSLRAAFSSLLLCMSYALPPILLKLRQTLNSHHLSTSPFHSLTYLDINMSACPGLVAGRSWDVVNTTDKIYHWPNTLDRTYRTVIIAFISNLTCHTLNISINSSTSCSSD